MAAKTSFTGIARIGQVINELRTSVALLLTLIALPLAGVVLLFCADGKLRAIGLGFFVYLFALFVALPMLAMAATAKRGSNARIFASFACFWLSFFTYFYLQYAAIKPDMVARLMVTVPISLLGFIFFGWWVRDLFLGDT